MGMRGSAFRRGERLISQKIPWISDGAFEGCALVLERVRIISQKIPWISDGAVHSRDARLREFDLMTLYSVKEKNITHALY